VRRRAITGGPEGARLEPKARRHLLGLREGFNSGLAARTTRRNLPRSVAEITHSPFDLCNYAIVLDGRVIGTCGLKEGLYAGLELAIVIFEPKDRGRGIGTFAVRALCDIAFSQLHTHRIELAVYRDNEPARRIYERCGFKAEAVLRKFVYNDGAWRDGVWMSLLRREWMKKKRARR
jgi:RimJ/RimL family protein N-acetyltransferase